MKLYEFAVGSAIVLILFAIILANIGDNAKKQSTKTRVPTIQQRGYPPKDEPTSTGIPDKRPEELHPPSVPVAPVKQEPPKEGRSERTNFGLIISVEESEEYLVFTFQEDGGFQKRFARVCSDQIIQTGRPMAILYHWKAYHGEAHNERGCYVIDGYQLK